VAVPAVEENARVLGVEVEENARVLGVEVEENASVLGDQKKVACMVFGPYARNKTSRRSPLTTTTMELASVSRIASVTIAHRKSEKRLDMGLRHS
jgi:hypothetical protein